MAETLTSIQIRPSTRDKLRQVKAEVAAEAQRTVDYDDMVRALLRNWRERPVGDLRELLELEAN
jgi:hypothetical protein